MENATKALLIAGGVLIAILIVTIAIFLFKSYGNIGKSYETTMESNERIKFNNNFLKYQGRTDITAQEIVTVINYASDYNKKNEIKIEVSVYGLGNVTNLEQSKLIEFIKNNSDKRFKCSNITIDDDGRVNKIVFNKSI